MACGLEIGLGNFFFRTAQTFCKHCANHFRYRHAVFSTNGGRTREKNVRGRFLNFVMWPCEESDKVENYRFLENCSMEFAENQRKKSVFNILSPPALKNFKIGSENFRIRFFQILIFALLIFSAFHRNPSSSFRETDNFRLCPIPQLTT